MASTEDADEKAIPDGIQRKRTFTLHEKRVSDTMQFDFLALYDEDRTEFRKKTAALLRENPDLFNVNEIGTVANDNGHVSLEQWQGFLNSLLKPELCTKIFECIDHDNKSETVALTAITRFLSGRSRVSARPKTIIDEAWLVHKLKDVDIGKIDNEGNNRIKMEDFKTYFGKLKKEVPDDIVEKLFYEIDKDEDGHISTFEYFKWKEGFKLGVLNQIDPAKIRKSTTKLTGLNSGSQRGKRMNVRFGDDADDETITKLKATIARLRAENVEQDEMINDKDTEIARLQAQNTKRSRSTDEKTTQTETTMQEMEQVQTQNAGYKDKAERDQQNIQQLKDRENEYQQNIVELENELKDKQSMSSNVDGLTARVHELESLLTESQTNAKQNEKLLQDVTGLNEAIEDKDATIKKYEDKMEALQNEYKKEMQNKKGFKERFTALQTKLDSVLTVPTLDNNDVEELQKALAEKDELIKKIKSENEAEMEMMKRDNDNLCDQLEETYSIVNEELIDDKKYNKKKKKKSKVIENSGDLRKKLKKLKSKIDVKDEKIKQYKSQRLLSHNDQKVDKKEEKRVIDEENKGDNKGIFSFLDTKNFVFLKDF